MSVEKSYLPPKSPKISWRVDELSAVLPMAIVFVALLFSALSSNYLLGLRNAATLSSVVRYGPLALLIVAAFLAALAQPARRSANIFLTSLKTNYFLTIFALLSVTGSLVARLFLGRETSYFTQAGSILTFFIAFYVFASVPNTYWRQAQRWLFRLFLLITLISAVVVVIRLVETTDKTRPSTVLLLTQGIALIYYFFRRGSGFYLFFGLISFLTILTFKNTAVVIMLLTYVGVYLLPKYKPSRFSVRETIPLLLVGAIAFGFVAGLYLIFASGFTDGHTDFRWWLIQVRFEEFLRSPLVGSMFTSETSALFERDNVLVPTHNDFMDVLAQGGILGTALFVGAFVRTFILLLRTRQKTIFVMPNTFKTASWLLFFIMATVVSFVLNPILGTTDIALVIWVNFALAHRIAYVAQNDR